VLPVYEYYSRTARPLPGLFLSFLSSHPLSLSLSAETRASASSSTTSSPGPDGGPCARSPASARSTSDDSLPASPVSSLYQDEYLELLGVLEDEGSRSVRVSAGKLGPPRARARGGARFPSTRELAARARSPSAERGIEIGVENSSATVSPGHPCARCGHRPLHAGRRGLWAADPRAGGGAPHCADAEVQTSGNFPSVLPSPPASPASPRPRSGSLSAPAVDNLPTPAACGGDRRRDDQARGVQAGDEYLAGPFPPCAGDGPIDLSAPQGHAAGEMCTPGELGSESGKRSGVDKSENNFTKGRGEKRRHRKRASGV
jgi:hypothetical protein